MTGCAWQRLLVNTAAAELAGPSFTTSATSRVPLALNPAVTPAARNPWGAVTLTGSSSLRSLRSRDRPRFVRSAHGTVLVSFAPLTGQSRPCAGRSPRADQEPDSSTG